MPKKTLQRREQIRKQRRGETEEISAREGKGAPANNADFFIGKLLELPMKSQVPLPGVTIDLPPPLWP